MSICVLDGREIKDKEMLHNKLAVSLGFPDWYGKNLDAFYDCLTDLQEETEICLLYENAMEEDLRTYIGDLVKVIDRAKEENSKIRWNKGD